MVQKTPAGFGQLLEWHSARLDTEFFYQYVKKISPGQWANILKFIGAANIMLLFLIVTPLHDLGTISIVLTLFGLFTITVLFPQVKTSFAQILLYYLLVDFLLFLFAFWFRLHGFVPVIMQKVYIVSSILLVLGFEYFAKREDFIQIKSGTNKMQATNYLECMAG